MSKMKDEPNFRRLTPNPMWLSTMFQKQNGLAANSENLGEINVIEIKSFRRFRRGAGHPTRNLSEIDERSLNVIENTGSRQFRFSRNP